MADEAAELRRRRSGPCGCCCQACCYRFFIAIVRTVANHDFGGSAPDAVVWSAGSLSKKRRVVQAVRDLAMLPGPEHIWGSQWVGFVRMSVAARPFSVSLLVKSGAFFGTLHWPGRAAEVEEVMELLGGGGVSYCELLILCELWTGERLVLERAIPWCRRGRRQMSVSAVSLGPVIDICARVRFLVACQGHQVRCLVGERFFP